jgi:F-type H+-transporting ATPase subunit epsilon
MHLEIITPDKTLFEGSITSIQLPGTNGSFEILNNHAPMISALGKGKVRIIGSDKQTSELEINSGVVEILSNKIVVLAE